MRHRVWATALTYALNVYGFQHVLQ